LEDQTKRDHYEARVLDQHIPGRKTLDSILQTIDLVPEIAMDGLNVPVQPGTFVLDTIADVVDPLHQVSCPSIQLCERSLITPTSWERAKSHSAARADGPCQREVN
jgi:hypothetical protein